MPVRLPLWGPDIPLGGRDVLFRPGRGELSRGSGHPELDSPPPNLQPQLGSPSREGRTPTGAPPSHCLRSATWGRAPGPLPPALRTCLGCTAGPGLTGREQRGRRTPRGPNTSTPRLGSADSPSVCRPAAEGATCTGAPGGRCPTPVWHIPVTLALSGAAASRPPGRSRRTHANHRSILAARPRRPGLGRPVCRVGGPGPTADRRCRSVRRDVRASGPGDGTALPPAGSLPPRSSLPPLPRSPLNFREGPLLNSPRYPPHPPDAGDAPACGLRRPLT